MARSVRNCYSESDPVTRHESGPVLSLRNVSKSYHNLKESTQVLEALELELFAGEITCLLGASGCGKSTIVSLIAGLLVPDSGEVLFDGRNLGAMSDTQRAQLRATRIGIVLQSGNLVPFLTAGENIAMAIRLAGGASSPAMVGSLLDRVGLADRADHLPKRLSGGEAQRVALAVALASNPTLLLADEAVGQLDAETALVVMSTLDRACREDGLAVLLVTHDLEIAAKGTRIVRVSAGRMEGEA